MIQWQIDIPEEIDRMVRSRLERSGQNGDLTQYVNKAIRQRVLRDTLREIHERNAHLDPDEIESLVDEAVNWAREDRP